MDKLLNKTFLKFLTRFIIIIMLGLAGALVTGIIGDLKDSEQAAPIKTQEN